MASDASLGGKPALWYQCLLPSELWYVYLDENILIPHHFTSNQIAAIHELLLPQEWFLLIITIYTVYNAHKCTRFAPNAATRRPPR